MEPDTSQSCAWEPASCYRFDAYELRPHGAVLLHDGTVVDLASKCTLLLAHLIRNRTRTVARDELRRALWPDVVVADGSLTQAIWEIRRALSDQRRRPRFIQTKHGLGYRFIGALKG